MPIDCNTETRNPLEELIQSCKPMVEHFARTFASSVRSPLLEFEDYVSVGLTKLCEVAREVLSADNPVTYGCTVARHAMIDEYHHTFYRQCPTISLDAPLSPDHSLCLLDLLSDCSDSFPVLPSAMERAISDALGRLGARQRDALSYRYGLPGYGYAGQGEAGRVLGVSANAMDVATHHGCRKLRQDEALCAVVGVQG